MIKKEDIKSLPIEFYADKIAKNEQFSLMRWGDMDEKHCEYIYQKIDLYVWLSTRVDSSISHPSKGSYLDFSAVCLKCGKMKGSHVKEILPYMTGATTCEFAEDPIKTPMAKTLYLFLGGKV